MPPVGARSMARLTDRESLGERYSSMEGQLFEFDLQNPTFRLPPTWLRAEGGDGRLKAAAAAITVFVSVQ